MTSPVHLNPDLSLFIRLFEGSRESIPSFISYSSTTLELVNFYEESWMGDRFVFPDLGHLLFDVLNQLVRSYEPEYDPARAYGVVKKKDEPQGTVLLIKGDIHGDLLSVLKTLKGYQEEGFLDSHYLPKENVRLIFDGDFCDRGANSVEVLLLLGTLCLESDQVFLIRGNHENVTYHRAYLHLVKKSKYFDSSFEMFLSNKDYRNTLEKFYQTLPLGYLIGTQAVKRQYTLITHGTFDPSFYPGRLLAKPSDAYEVVFKNQKLDETIIKLASQEFSKGSKEELFVQSAKRVVGINQARPHTPDDTTAFLWGDIGVKTKLGKNEERGFVLSPADICAFFHTWNQANRLSEIPHTVELLIRGHQHKGTLHREGSMSRVITLPTGMLHSPFRDMKLFKDEKDTNLVVLMSQKVEDATWYLLQRDPKNPDHLIRSKQATFRAKAISSV